MFAGVHLSFFVYTIPAHKLNNFHLVCTNTSRKSKFVLKLRAFPKSWSEM